jgi:hypothetical protein
MNFQQLQSLAEVAPAYLRLRGAHPDKPAATVLSYLRNGEGETFEQFCCPGHDWVYTGSLYGGDDDSYHGEGRCYCALCGADGDA